ncbi:calcium uniporter protein, mitochondrial-like [Alosa sapidissima]|uniref:calcium uniporter protein, mitochondrial-like n=1 Tax=Alosa sapidissima TaxID=34773 RepID=UPI001C09A9BC|nr:calcium uniporter protein, mitochondrial-like [Alosa sapidissima]
MALGLVAKLQAGVIRHALPCSLLKTTTIPVHLTHKAQPRVPLWRCHQVLFCSTVAPSHDVAVQFKHGRPAMAVPLPSRREKCLFYLRPMLMTVSDFIQDLQTEDPGITAAAVLTTEGEKVACTTSIDTLLSKDFKLVINDAVYNVQSSYKELSSHEHALGMKDVKHVVHLLHTALHQPDHHILKERELLEKLDGIKQELSPLEKVKAQLVRNAELRSSRAVWMGMALLSVQGGALAWLTWWVYSWDVMEPVTYFITYTTSIGVFAYYVLTKQDYVYPDAKDRQFLQYFHKGAKKAKFNVDKYNQLKGDLAEVEEDLRRLRNPNQLQLPLDQIQPHN